MTVDALVSDALRRTAAAGQPLGRWRIKRDEGMPRALRLISRRGAAGSAAGLRLRSDGELIALACEGDADAFGVLYDRYAGVAYSLAHRICRDRGGAEDAVQEAFVSLWRGRDRYDPARGQVRTWLMGIVHNAAIDRVRRSRVHERRRASDDAIEDRLEAPDRIEDEVLEREQAKEIREALDALPPEQRHVIELAYFDGLSHSQIASALAHPVGTVKGRMRLGLTKLQAQLSGQDQVSTAEEVPR